MTSLSRLQDVGTLDSGLNSTVLASNNEFVILPVNEPTFGTPRKSQIQTYLEQNEGPGLQHLALKTEDIFTTLRLMQERSPAGGFEFMPRASDAYYECAPPLALCLLPSLDFGYMHTPADLVCAMQEPPQEDW